MSDLQYTFNLEDHEWSDEDKQAIGFYFEHFHPPQHIPQDARHNWHDVIWRRPPWGLNGVYLTKEILEWLCEGGKPAQWMRTVNIRSIGLCTSYQASLHRCITMAEYISHVCIMESIGETRNLYEPFENAQELSEDEYFLDPHKFKEAFSVYAQTPKGTFLLRVAPSWSAERLLWMMCTRLQVPFDLLYATFNTRQLKSFPKATLQQYGLYHECTVQVCMRLKGGVRGTSSINSKRQRLCPVLTVDGLRKSSKRR